MVTSCASKSLTFILLEAEAQARTDVKEIICWNILISCKTFAGNLETCLKLSHSRDIVNN